MSDEIKALLSVCAEALFPLASMEYPIAGTVSNMAAMYPGVTVGDIRRAHEVRQDVLIALAKVGAS